MNDSFRQITLTPALPCVYHGCNGEAKVAIAYAVSEHEWRLVPTCEQHTVHIPANSEHRNELASHR